MKVKIFAVVFGSEVIPLVVLGLVAFYENIWLPATKGTGTVTGKVIYQVRFEDLPGR